MDKDCAEQGEKALNQLVIMDVKAAVGICNWIVQDLCTVQVILNFNRSLTQKRVLLELEVSS